MKSLKSPKTLTLSGITCLTLAWGASAFSTADEPAPSTPSFTPENSTNIIINDDNTIQAQGLPYIYPTS